MPGLPATYPTLRHGLEGYYVTIRIDSYLPRETEGPQSGGKYLEQLLPVHN
jgi:hypothetical protein